MKLQKLDQRTIAGPHALIRAGSFGMGVLNVTATYTFPVASGDDLVITSIAVGTAGNSLDFQATDDGRTIDMEVETSDSNFDSVVRFDEDSWNLRLVSGNGFGGGIDLYEDTTNKILTLIYEDAVSDFDDFETAIGTTTHASILSGTTSGATTLQAASGHVVTDSDCGVECWVEEVSDVTHLHFTNAVTLSSKAQTTINSAYATGDNQVLASGAGTSELLATGDAVAAQSLSGGVDAVAISNIRGWDYDVELTGTGEYTVTFERLAQDLYTAEACLMLDSADDVVCVVGPYVAASKTIVITTVDISGTAAKDIAVHDNNRINFVLKVKFK